MGRVDDMGRVFSISSCIPGLAYEGGLTYAEFSGDDLMNLASIHVQRQFYQVIDLLQLFS